MNSVRFGAFEFDVATAELRKSGLPVSLERQPALTLALLVSRAGRLVPREDLRRAVWPSDVHVDFDRGLNYCIRQLRAALNDDARAPTFIETVPRQGYRFVAPVEAVREGATRRPWSLAVRIAAALLVVAGLGWDRVSPDPERSARHHAAALTALRTIHSLIF